MRGRTCLSLALVLGLGLAISALSPRAARAEPSFTVTPARPLPTDLPTFTLIETNPSGLCNPVFAPQPTIDGNVLTFHGTRATEMSETPTSDCPSAYRHDWQLGPLAAGTYTARVEVNGLQIATLDFPVGTSPAPRLSFSPAHPNQGNPITVTVSGVALDSCAPLLSGPLFTESNILIDGRHPLYPVTPDCEGPWSQEFSIPPLLPGTYQVTVRIDFNLYASATLVVDYLYLPPAFIGIDPGLPTTRDRLTLTGSFWRNCPATFGLPILSGDRIVLPATLGSPCTGPQVGKIGQATIGPLPAGSYLVELEVDGLFNEGQGITVTEPATVLPLVDHRFAVTVDRSLPNADPPGGLALAVPLTDQSGYFWFFDATNIELTVKILDGRAVNGHYWVFVASMTDVPFTVRIEDLGSPLCTPKGSGCPVKTYTTTGGVNENFIDVGSL